MNRDEQDQRAVSRALEDYIHGRREFYAKFKLAQLLKKDVLMLALKGASNADQFVEFAFSAFESSSEETKMGDVCQRIALDLANPPAIDASDMLLERDGVLWAVEVKAQTNTLNSKSKPQTLRELQHSIVRYRSNRTVRRREVQAMIGIVRGGARDTWETYHAQPHDTANRDLDDFKYRYIVGKNFWKWLTGRDNIAPVFAAIDTTRKPLVEAIIACIARLKTQMRESLKSAGLSDSIEDVIQFVQAGR